jgi:hypothetical protein
VIVIFALPVLVYQNQTALSKTMKANSNDLIVPIGGAVSYYTFTVPEEAVNPRPVTPGKTYYLEFHNRGLFAGERTTQIDFSVEYE